MNNSNETIPTVTIEAIARSLFKETAQYGFKQVDYLRLVNFLLDLSMKDGYAAMVQPSVPISYSAGEKIDFPLIGERVRIRQFIKDRDVAAMERWLALQEHQQFLICWTKATRSELSQLIEDDANILGIITLNHDEDFAIGAIGFFDVDRIQRKSELRAFIGAPEYKGRGLLREAIKLWMGYGIGGLGLKKICLHSTDLNIRTIKLNEELGFKVEGILRRECCLDGQYYDILRMGYLAE